MMGIYFGYVRERGLLITSSRMFWLALSATTAAVISIEPSADSWHAIVSGMDRAIFTVLTFVFTALFCLYDFKPTSASFRAGVLVGEASYSVYLLHPLIYQRWPIASMAPLLSFVALPILTVILASIVFHLFEKPILRLKLKQRDVPA
ncbi:MAG: hypothetical protein JSS22_05815 [Proteobacteria bacterium]|nr:hypothetical protein [Pseudomonadota bacterium]